MLDYRGEFDQNIALYFTETDSIRYSGWPDYINLMDSAWVACKDSQRTSISSGVNIPVEVMPVPCDPSRYAQRYEKLIFPELDGKFVFYFVGEVTRRKNLVALLKAFHIEFEPDEPVGLLIKANYPGLSPEECSQRVVEMTKDVKKQLKKFKDTSQYKGEVVITQRLSQNQMMQLHITGDCFVMPSFGEGWNLPAFDAMGLGKTPICIEQGGAKDFLSYGYETAGWHVISHSEPCFGMADASLPELYSGMENWQNISVNGLRRVMRYAYEMKELREKRGGFGIDRVYDFSYDKIGSLMKEKLENGPTILPDRDGKEWKKHDCRFMVKSEA
jgi:glycosyltransferase involved in cell wall biosynthesis